MERRLVLFVVLSSLIFVAYAGLVRWLHPQPRRPQQGEQVAVGKDAGKKQPAPDRREEPPPKAPQEGPSEGPAKEPEKAAAEIRPAPEPEAPEEWVTLGSADADQKQNPYRMLVTLGNKGAAVARIELSSPRYCDIDDRSGYLGHLAMDGEVRSDGCLVQVVGAGTPAAEAGLKPGDVIKTVDGNPVVGRESLEHVLSKMRPRERVDLLVVREDKELTLRATLRRQPLEVVKPEKDDPLSMLMTLQQLDQQKIGDKAEKEDEKQDEKQKNEKEKTEEKERLNNAFIRAELPGVKLRTANWKIISADQSHAQFRCVLPEKGLEVTKTYTLAKAPEDSLGNGDFPAYHLEFQIEIRNLAEKAHQVAYRLDGPNGLPTEGKWYASKVSRNWGGAGLRDFVISFGGVPDMIGAATISAGTGLPIRPDTPPDRLLTYIGVDAQYFSAILMPVRSNPADVWFEELLPIRVGKVDPKHTNLTNTSCRLVSTLQELEPGGALVHRFKFFAGPKKPALLRNPEYRLDELVYFGWPVFAWTAVPLTAILHWFYAVTGNYGLAIVLLTVLVRGCMFPLSLKQAAGAQKMQQLQPEIKKIQEKYKNTEARTRAQQELFRKHNYNPLSGCLPIFIQLPVFIGLYRSLMVAIELRDATLISNSIRWCSNLAAPDMLFDWSGLWRRVGLEFVNSGTGIFGLGPYFNLLPILTVALILWQQKVLMPPPADEQAAMQQKIMQYMMVFMGLLFFKVASGLCIYFIASSIWGLLERRFLPKTTPPAGSSVDRAPKSPPSLGGGGETRAQAKARARAEAQAAAKKKSWWR